LQAPQTANFQICQPLIREIQFFQICQLLKQLIDKVRKTIPKEIKFIKTSQPLKQLIV